MDKALQHPDRDRAGFPRHQGFTALQIANPQVRFEGIRFSWLRPAPH
ncbi:hypothetical protein ACFO1V_02550 [Daeguia caeni]|uniref:Uncharacterized protein n=1 Tax=Daeguia caeni TaxID=439612 RepID=A0ABV9H0Z3_9HYPH